MSPLPPLDVVRLGRVEYEDGLALQEALAAAVGARNAPDTMLLLEHDPVLTLGRGTHGESANILFPPDYLAARGVTVHETGRGGDVTWHGPGQLVGYPIVDLARARETKDVRRFVRSLEEIMVRTCADYGVAAARDETHTGVWVGKDKVGAIGVRVAKWVTTHGFALNVSPDLSYFDLIVPCGITDRGVTSLTEALGRDVPFEEVEEKLAAHAGAVFGRGIVSREVDQTTVAVAVRRADRLLVLRRAPDRGGFWQIVTGRIEAGESPRDAAARELLEETGLGPEQGVELRPLGYEHAFGLALPATPDGARPRLAREVCFFATVPEGAEARLSSEHDDLAWLPPDEAAARVKYAGHRRALRLAVARR